MEINVHHRKINTLDKVIYLNNYHFKQLRILHPTVQLGDEITVYIPDLQLEYTGITLGSSVKVNSFINVTSVFNVNIFPKKSIKMKIKPILKIRNWVTDSDLKHLIGDTQTLVDNSIYGCVNSTDVNPNISRQYLHDISGGMFT